MKPSEKRALEAEKKRLREEKNSMDVAAHESTDRSPEGSDGKVYRRRESFFSNHVKLITFLIVGSIVLLGFAFGIDMYVISKKGKSVTNLEDMTMNTVYAIHDNADNMKWRHFKKYNYNDYSFESKEGKYIVREYPIADSRLVLKVGGSSVNTTLDYAQLIDYETGNFVDVLKTDPHEFVKSIGQEEKK